MNGFTASDATKDYPAPPLNEAIQIAQEWIDEWDYEEDPGGYCHIRPVLIALVARASRTQVLIKTEEA